MKRRILSIGTALVLSLVLILACVFPVLAQPQAASEDVSWADEIPAMLSAGSYEEGEVIVGVVASGKSITGDDLLADSEELFDVTGADIEDPAVTVPEHAEIDIVCIQRDDMTTEEILYRLAGKRNVVFAEPNYVMDTQAVKKTGDGSLFPEEDPAAPEAAEGEAATDPEITERPVETVTQETSSEARAASVRLNNYADLTPQQWSSWDDAAYIIEGQGGNSIHVPNFDTQSGDMEGDPVVVAVIDSSIDFSHPDLAPAAYTFTEEQQRILGCDVHGFNACSESTDGILVYYPKIYHGTHCAGIIGAAWDGQGVSGVASNVKLVSIQNHIEDGYTSLVNALRAFDFIDRANELGCGISIASNSWSLVQDSRALDAAIRNLGEKWEILVLFAAGNDCRDAAARGRIGGTLFDNPYVITVAAMDSAGKIATYSDYGALTVDLGAPGSGILSTINTGANNLQYLADATPDTNKYYNGFEDGEIPGLKWIDMNGEETEAAAELTEDSRFAGSKGLKLTLPGEETDFYTLEIDLGDVTGRGVQAGDLAGFTLGAVGTIGGWVSQYMDKSTHEWEDVPVSSYVFLDSNSWVNPFFEIPENADLTDLKFRFSFYPYDDLSEAIYLDSLGIGTECVPYAIQDGTSMACPCAAGFAAVLKSQYPQASATELAALVKAKVCPNESLAGLTKTGGMIDFLVDGTPGSPETAFNPTIQDITVSGRIVTVMGTNFTDSGKAVVSRYVAGKEKEVKNASVVSWTDTEVVLSLADDFQGILEAEIENKDGKTDTHTKFVSKSDNLYEEELPFDKSTGEPYVFDGEGDYETKGPLIGLDNKLYYLPALMKTENTPAYQRMRCFDIASQTWTELPGMPEWLTYVSAVMYDGKIVVKGLTMVLAPDGSPQWDETDYQIKVYYYDPDTGVWSEGSAENVYDSDTIANNDGQLILVGGGEQEQKPSSVRKYDLSTGPGEMQYELLDCISLPRVTCRNGSIYIFDPEGWRHQRVQNGTAEYITDAMPAYLDSCRIPIWEYSSSSITEYDGYFVPVSEGILFVGPTAADGSGDTYILRDGSDRFELYEKRMSDCKVNFPAVASYRGYVYAIGTVYFEPGQAFFRRTAMDVPEYPGDIPQREDPDTPVTPDTPSTPDTPVSPKTADESNLSLWILLLALSTGGIIGAAVIYKKRRSE